MLLLLFLSFPYGDSVGEAKSKHALQTIVSGEEDFGVCPSLVMAPVISRRFFLYAMKYLIFWDESLLITNVLFCFMSFVLF